MEPPRGARAGRAELLVAAGSGTAGAEAGALVDGAGAGSGLGSACQLRWVERKLGVDHGLRTHRRTTQLWERKRVLHRSESKRSNVLLIGF